MLISLVIPVYNEEENLIELYQRLNSVFRNNAYFFEIIFVDDGSQDKSLEILKNLYQKDNHIKIIKLKRNFGQVPAVLAGIRIAQGDTIITLDADLQNPPEKIPEFVNKINQGFQAVFGYRIKRKDYLLRKFGSHLIWQLIALRTGIKIRDPGCGFNAIKKEFINKIIRKYGEGLKNIKHISAKETNLVSQIAVSHYPRERGKSKYGFFKLITYAGAFLKEIFSKKIVINISPYEVEEILE